MFLSILSALGSIASIISIIYLLRHNKKKYKIIFLVVLVLCLSVVSTFLAYKNYELTNDRLIRQRLYSEAVLEAKKLVNAFPPSNYWTEGVNEGIVMSGMAYLEKYKEIFPDTYQMVKQNVMKDFNEARNNRDSSTYRYIMNNAANSMTQNIKAIAGSD